MTNASLSKELLKLQDAYLKALPEKLSKIRESWHNVLGICEMMRSDSDITTEELQCSYPWNWNELINLQRLVHNLSGSGLTFGFKAISEIAHTLDLFLQAIIQKTHPPTLEQCHQITTLIQCLESTPLPSPLSGSSSSIITEQNSKISIDIAQERRTQEHHIFLLEEDFNEGELLGFQLNSFGYQVTLFQSLSKLQEAIAKTLPDIILMNIDYLNGYQLESQFISQFRSASRWSIPIFFISSEDSLEARIKAVRAQGNAYFTKPVNVWQLVDKLDYLMIHSVAEPYHILIVEDDPVLADYYQLILRQQSGQF